MKKKGFTLVELLAVIAILAILVIMALPAVLRMFNNARRDSFTNEVNTIIRTARQQYLLSGGTETAWSNANGSTNTLSLTGNSRLQYNVEMNNEGKIIKLQVTNGDFQYNKTDSNGIDVASSSDVTEATGENIIVATPTVAYTAGYYPYDDSPITIDNAYMYFDNYQDLVANTGRNMFTILELDSSGQPTAKYLGLLRNNNFYRFRLGGATYGDTLVDACGEGEEGCPYEYAYPIVEYSPYYATNKSLAASILGSSNCDEHSYGDYRSYYCTIADTITISVTNDGLVNIYDWIDSRENGCYSSDENGPIVGHESITTNCDFYIEYDWCANGGCVDPMG